MTSHVRHEDTIVYTSQGARRALALAFLPLMPLCAFLQNISEGKYKNFDEFKADAQLIVHNTAILHGGRSDPAAELAK